LRQLGGVDHELRAAMLGSQVVGLTFARHVVGIPTLRDAEAERLVAYLSGVFEVYLRGLPAGR
jgi:hypothetical protein